MNADVPDNFANLLSTVIASCASSAVICVHPRLRQNVFGLERFVKNCGRLDADGGTASVPSAVETELDPPVRTATRLFKPL